MKVYYDTLHACSEEIYLAATDIGLCFVSNSYNEMIDWLTKRQASEFIHDQDKMQPYMEQFAYYFSGEKQQFDAISLDISGTDFQMAVWQELRTIHFGETCCYSDIAQAIGKPTAVRAVASAIGKNPLLVIIPCHRVIGKNGKLTGFRSGLALKKQLLALEKTIS